MFSLQNIMFSTAIAENRKNEVFLPSYAGYYIVKINNKPIGTFYGKTSLKKVKIDFDISLVNVARKYYSLTKQEKKDYLDNVKKITKQQLNQILKDKFLINLILKELEDEDYVKIPFLIDIEVIKSYKTK